MSRATAADSRTNLLPAIPQSLQSGSLLKLQSGSLLKLQLGSLLDSNLRTLFGIGFFTFVILAPSHLKILFHCFLGLFGLYGGCLHLFLLRLGLNQFRIGLNHFILALGRLSLVVALLIGGRT